MLLYALLPKIDWDHERPVREHGGVIFVTANALHGRVADITGRDALSRYPSVRDRLHRRGRVYIAGRRGMPGLLVERVELSRKPPASILDSELSKV